jgi:hypothetical protein
LKAIAGAALNASGQAGGRGRGNARATRQSLRGKATRRPAGQLGAQSDRAGLVDDDAGQLGASGETSLRSGRRLMRGVKIHVHGMLTAPSADRTSSLPVDSRESVVIAIETLLHIDRMTTPWARPVATIGTHSGHSCHKGTGRQSLIAAGHILILTDGRVAPK